MVQLTVEERVLLVTTYLRIWSLEAARNAFRDRFTFQNDSVEERKNIEKQRQVITETKGYLGDPKTARTLKISEQFVKFWKEIQEGCVAERTEQVFLNLLSKQLLPVILDDILTR